jgi:hypothetical protein
MFRPGLDAPASLSRATVTLSESLVLLPDSTSSSNESYSESLSFCRPCADLAPADSAWTVPISRISARWARPKPRTCRRRLYQVQQVVPPFATGARQWGEFVSGGSQNPDLRPKTPTSNDWRSLSSTSSTQRFRLTFEWVPRDLNVRADFLSHALEYSQHSYRLCEECFAYLNGLWGPHSIDRFASAEDCQPLIAPNAGRFCSRFFHPDAEWTDALTIGWAVENNWSFSPTHAVGTAVTHLRAAGAEGTLICPNAPWASWWHLLRAGLHWAPDIVGTVHLGPASSALIVGTADRHLFGPGGILEVRFAGRA